MQVPDAKKFLKGLIVVDNVAYFGIAPHAERQARAEPNMDCELAAVHLDTRHLVFRQKVSRVHCHSTSSSHAGLSRGRCTQLL